MSLVKLFEKINLKPNNKDLYYEALTHSSFVNEKRSGRSYDRLEFVGDALVAAEIAIYLFNKFEDIDEGTMTVIRANFVNSEALANYSRALNLQNLIRVGNGAEEIRNNTKVQADLFESLCAAIYFDFGIGKLRMFLKFNIFKDIDNSKGAAIKNPKTILQEYLQLNFRGVIKYETTKKSDMFHTYAIFDGVKLGSGVAKSKKQSEIEAARNALDKYNKGGDNETN
ncbi:ribonuclease III [Candidatus Mycoplasma mahonii]|uniref:ribonuclease III n=1 Tax=Candidatus Mycoplasma mahonii TaxID=3004105 RepID=UPI0026F03099|nr:ribonuclease III [Candidatus Mycoplasma mahonii]WKX02726.1 ribonuclease III [Candidatus Mycoplasma mahonii]